MKLLVYSDLHLEFKAFQPPKIFPDVVILAGDIATKTRGVQWGDESFDCPVLYVLGNHELYDGHLDKTLQKMKAIEVMHLRVMENEVLELNGVRFLGTTGWTDYSSTGNVVAAQRVAFESMNDFRYIRIGEDYRRIRPDDLIERNQVARKWLEHELRKPYAGKTVVITHHAPSLLVAGDKHDGHLTAAYFNQWEDLMALADVWVFGHTHRKVDQVVAGCRVVSNPRGYPHEPTGFDPGMVIEI